MEKAPVFIILGGNTLARGLTLEGLVCTYFARNVNQSDTLMQMARWFGYRHGYELLQRIWMPIQVQRKFELIEEIDEKLKKEFEAFMKMGKIIIHIFHVCIFGKSFFKIFQTERICFFPIYVST